MEPLKTLNVFWIDDQHKEPGMQIFSGQAEQYGINLHPFTSAEEGLPVLEKRLEFFDAVLFDALFFQRKNQESGTEEVDGLSAAIAKVNELKHLKSFRPFILSGQERLDSDRTFKATFGEFYRKQDPQDVQRLFRDIRSAAEAMADTQIRHRFQRVFEVCTDRYIGEAAASELMSILRREDADAFGHDANTHINAIRKIVEDLFRACNRESLVPDAFITGSVKLNETCRYLGGLPEMGYQIRTGIVPRMVGELLEKTLSIAQPASHRLHVDEHMRAVRSPYLLYATVYMLMDVLIWFKGFVDDREQQGGESPLFDTVQAGAVGAALHSGPLERDGFGNYHCGEYSITPGQINGRHELGENLVITHAEENTSPRNAHLYPKFAKRFRKA